MHRFVAESVSRLGIIPHLRWREVPLILAVFLDMLGFSMLIPDVQFRAEGFGASGWQIGAILASTFVIQTLLSPVSGRLSDRWGRKVVFVVCTLVSASSMLVYGLAGTTLWILVSRMLAGIGAANVAIAQASVADVSTPAERTVILGRLSAAMSAGLIVGPSIGGPVSAEFGHFWIGIVGAAASTLGAVLVGLFSRMTAGSGKTEEKRPRFSILRQTPHVAPLIAVAGVAWFALAMLEGTFGRLIERNLGFTQREFGLIFSFESIVGLVVQGLALAWLAKRIAERNLLSVAYVGIGMGVAGMAVAPSFTWLLVTGAAFAAGFAIANPTVSGICSKAVSEREQGELFGVLQSARSVGFVLGPLVGGALFDWRPESPYFLAGAVCLAAAVLVRLIVTDRPAGADQAEIASPSG